MKILVVDDELDSRVIAQKAVNALGHECFTASDGTEALEVFNSTEPDVVLTDWMMPEPDGLELCRLIRDSDGEHYTYVILLTSLENSDHALAAMRAGADDYMVKPLVRDELEQRLVVASRISDTLSGRVSVKAVGVANLDTAPTTNGSLRVMVADDDESTVLMLSAMIESEPDLELVGTAADATEATELALRERPHVAILDWNMPGGGGGVAAAVIREKTPTTRVVALSGSDNPEASFDMLRSGARNFLGKGVSKEKLIASIKDAAEPGLA